jgi:hypothetical protein
LLTTKQAHELSAPWVTEAVWHLSRLLGIMGRKLEVSVRPQDGNICCTRNNVISSSSRLLAFLLFPLAANMLMYSGNTTHPEIIPASRWFCHAEPNQLRPIIACYSHQMTVFPIKQRSKYYPLYLEVIGVTRKDMVTYIQSRVACNSKSL